MGWPSTLEDVRRRIDESFSLKEDSLIDKEPDAIAKGQKLKSELVDLLKKIEYQQEYLTSNNVMDELDQSKKENRMLKDENDSLRKHVAEEIRKYEERILEMDRKNKIELAGLRAKLSNQERDHKQAIKRLKNQK